MRFVKQVKAAYIALSIAFVCMGLCLLIWPGISAVTICYVLGTASVLYGVIKLFGYFSEDLYQLAFQFDLAAGIFMLVIGILLLFHPDNVLTLLPTVIGLSILIDSVLKLQTAFDAKPVSYTHLDVYKRQVSALCGSRNGATRSFCE